MILLFPLITFSQSNIDKILKGGEIIVNGLSFIKGNKVNTGSKIIESICVKNKLEEKIIFRIIGKNDDGEAINKELVIQKDGKECFFLLQKGVYTYEVVLTNKDVFKKGEYKFDDEIIITIKNI